MALSKCLYFLVCFHSKNKIELGDHTVPLKVSTYKSLSVKYKAKVTHNIFMPVFQASNSEC